MNEEMASKDELWLIGLILLFAIPNLVNFLVILGNQHPFSFNFYFMLI